MPALHWWHLSILILNSLSAGRYCKINLEKHYCSLIFTMCWPMVSPPNVCLGNSLDFIPAPNCHRLSTSYKTMHGGARPTTAANVWRRLGTIGNHFTLIICQSLTCHQTVRAPPITPSMVRLHHSLLTPNCLATRASSLPVTVSPCSHLSWQRGLPCWAGWQRPMISSLVCRSVPAMPAASAISPG